MATFIGDYTCKVDTKGRVLFPSALKKQMSSATQDHFVVKKDIYEQCLVLYSMEEWKRQNDIIRKNTNPYNREHNQFIRGFFSGSAEVVLDASNRILLPKRLIDLVKINKEVVLSGQDTKIEIWPKDIYSQVTGTGKEFAGLAEKIMGGNINDTEGE